MADYRKAYGLPERYFLSLGRMVEKKNLATLVSAYARYAEGVAVAGKKLKVKGDDGEKHGAGSGEHGAIETTEARHSSHVTRHTPVALVFVGSGELEGALREQARSLGLRVVDRTDWRVEKTGHGFTRMNTDGSERLAADRTEGNAAGSVTWAGCEGPQSETDDYKLNTENSVENDRGAVYFYGFRQIEENPVFYALAEAFVLPSLKEEWGLVVNEAMAAGLPVIVSRTAGCAEDLLPRSGQVAGDAWRVAGKDAGDSLEQRSNGFVFDPKSSDALSEALRRIADQETNSRVFETARGRAEGKLKGQETNGLTEMGKRSREIVAKFSCENFARQALHAAEAAGA